ncbi:unnamed protein product, partial [Ectocarpus sp. 12 AP-2014]
SYECIELASTNIIARGWQEQATQQHPSVPLPVPPVGRKNFPRGRLQPGPGQRPLPSQWTQPQNSPSLAPNLTARAAHARLLPPFRAERRLRRRPDPRSLPPATSSACLQPAGGTRARPSPKRCAVCRC